MVKTPLFLWNPHLQPLVLSDHGKQSLPSPQPPPSKNWALISFMSAWYSCLSAWYLCLSAHAQALKYDHVWALAGKCSHMVISACAWVLKHDYQALMNDISAQFLLRGGGCLPWSLSTQGWRWGFSQKTGGEVLLSAFHKLTQVFSNVREHISFTI